MAHELATMADGRASMAYVGAKPWHGLGQLLPQDADLGVWVKEAGLDWSCLAIPSQYEFNGELLTDPSSFHMVRDDNGKSLSVMSGRYKPVQPAEVIGFFRDFILTDERFTLETAGVLKGGRIIWALAKFDGGLTAGGDAHVFYVLLTTSYDGTVATTAQGTVVRVVCNNTLTGSLWSGRDSLIRIPHYKDFALESVQADASEKLSKVLESMDKYKVLADALTGVRLAKFQVEGLFKRLTLDKVKDADKHDAPTGRARKALERLLESYSDTLKEGTEGGTAWAAFNGVTRYVDHNRTTRDTSGDGRSAARMASAFFGTGAALKREALGVLAEIGNIKLETEAA
jgi:phage/plasmid-like protein (TIGR03299 family)